MSATCSLRPPSLMGGPDPESTRRMRPHTALQPCVRPAQRMSAKSRLTNTSLLARGRVQPLFDSTGAWFARTETSMPRKKLIPTPKAKKTKSRLTEPPRHSRAWGGPTFPNASTAVPLSRRNGTTSPQCRVFRYPTSFTTARAFSRPNFFTGFTRKYVPDNTIQAIRPTRP
jgi:hypothetical protein